MIEVTQDKTRPFPVEMKLNSRTSKLTILAAIELRDKLTKAINGYTESVNPLCANASDCPVDLCPVYPRTKCGCYRAIQSTEIIETND
jgi:hypothetical protein